MSAETASATPPAPAKAAAGGGLRERKKERTRRTIRTEAFRLFREQGYAETTVEQIAAAADISPSTFFRYFPSKEQVALADDLDPLMIASIEAQPRDITLLAAFKQATLDAFAALTPAEYAFEKERIELLYSVPELRGAVTQEIQRNMVMVTEIAARWTGRAADDFEVMAFAGALTGAMMAFIDQYPFSPDQIVRVIEFLDGGMTSL
ncbi:acyl-CoA-like ligand-binding transcription factor [Nocardia sp. NPDC004340]